MTTVMKKINYQKYRNKIRTGDLVQFAPTDFISRIIRYKTKSAIAHSAMAYWHKSPIDQWRLWIIESVVFGVYPHYLSKRTAWYLPHGNMYWHSVRPEWQAYANQAAHNMLEYIGTQYDLKNLIKQAFTRVTFDPSKLYCNESIVGSWREIIRLPKDFIMPYPGEMTSNKFGVYKHEGQLIT